ncbi:tail protein [Lactobacillus phage phig1e]|uniref:tail protein n=1 Tax=Lactobacillus phage phig1e TaxID=52979 RepID=UPI0001B1BBE9|nr:tail protein [Lactobacillus phage phig1e]
MKLMTDIRPIAGADKAANYPVTHSQAVKDFDVGVTKAVAASPAKFFNLLKSDIVTWHDGLIPKTIKMQSPNGTVFLVSIGDDGKLAVTKEGDSDGNTTSN